MILAATIVVAARSRLGAQVVTGVVRDSISSEAIGGVTVEMYATSGQIAARDITDQQGLFRLESPGRGSYRLKFQRIGYRGGFSSALALVTRDTTVNFRMFALAAPVSSIEITASTLNYLQLVGFNERRKTEPGFFLDPKEVTKRASKATQTADLLDGIPGVTLLVGGGSWGLRVPVLTRQMGCDMGPRIYLDGNLVNSFQTMFDVNTINAIEIAAIEVYRSVSQIPLRWGGMDATCGVMVIWTKH